MKELAKNRSREERLGTDLAHLGPGAPARRTVRATAVTREGHTRAEAVRSGQGSPRDELPELRSGAAAPATPSGGCTDVPGNAENRPRDASPPSEAADKV